MLNLFQDLNKEKRTLKQVQHDINSFVMNQNTIIKNINNMPDENFEKIANNLIEEISAQIEEQDINYQIDINYSNEVLSLEINGKIYVINKQKPKSEIWLASPISGPYHYHLSNNSWIDSKGSELRSVLSNELSILLNRKIEIT